MGHSQEPKKMILGLSRIVLFFCLVLFSLLSHSCFFPLSLRLVPDRFSQLVVSLMPLLQQQAACVGVAKPVTTELATKLELSSPPPSCRPITAHDGWCVDELAIRLGD
ncbi:hypothetical protein NW754_016524 [Fusarium falciforme]|nr:hypothetical protein NW754_016524 [Fusarium falciforme]